MDSELTKDLKALCNELETQIEENVPACRVSNLGFSIIAFFDNKSMATIYPLSHDTVDLFANDFRDEEYDLKNISVAKCIELLQELATLVEETGTAAVAGYSPANAFAAPGQKSNRAIQQAEREGWQIMNEIDRLEHPFGEDPLGRLAMNGNSNVKKNSEGKRKSAIAHNYAGGSPLALSENSGSNSTGSLAESEAADVFTQLAEKLPVDGSEILDDKTLVLTIDCVSIFITAQDNNNFSTRTEIDGETIQESGNISLGFLTKWLFQICDQIQTKVAERDGIESEDVSDDDIFETLKSLARETGAYGGDDIIKNKSLTDLKGLCVSRPPFERKQSPASFIGETSGSNVTESFVRGQRMFNGAPVRLCENNAAKPYGNGLSGKKLVYTLNEGAKLVDRDSLPPKMKLSWDDKHGVVMVPESQPTKRPSWYFRGWK